jgi:hypothetical protein
LTITVQAFLLCDGVVIDSHSSKPIVQGVFDQIAAAAYPATHPNCSLFVRLLLEGETACNIGVAVLTPSGTRDLPIPQQSMKPAANGIVQAIINLQGLGLAEEGTYKFLLLINGIASAEFRLLAGRINPPDALAVAKGPLH